MFLARSSRMGAVTLVEVDMTAAARARADELAAQAPRIADACASVDTPAAELQFACRKCEYFASDCVGKEIPDPLFLLPRISEKRFTELRPYQRLSAVPDGIQLTPPQLRVFHAVRTGEPFVDRAALAELQRLVWPVYYLDFEAVAPALPWFANDAPYDVNAFQFSIHICDRVGHEIAHHEYLAPIGGDWRREIVVAMIAALGNSGSIATYTSYEKLRLTSMMALFPDLAPSLQSIIDRLVDFEPIVRNGYCHPGFLGRTSIKNVLPVVAPDLSYREMTVGNGLDAEGLFALMTVGRRDPVEHSGYREHLLRYCKLDTLAMVRLHEALAGLLG